MTSAASSRPIHTSSSLFLSELLHLLFSFTPSAFFLAMDHEQTFLRVHARLSGMLAQLLSPRLRSFLENLCLVVAILLLVLLAVMHVNFVSQAGCAKELSHDQIAEAELLQIKMVQQGLWSKKTFSETLEDMYPDTQSSSQRDSKVILTWTSWLRWFLSCALKNIYMKTAVPTTHGLSDYSSVAIADDDVEREAALLQLWDSWTLYSATWLAKVGDVARRFAKFWRDAGRELLFSNSKDGSHAFSDKDHASVEAGKQSDAFEPVYMYSVERGYLLLPADAKSEHNIRTMNKSMSARNSCFGNRWQQLLINSLVGYDTILMNSLLEARGEGYLYNYQTKELYDLNYPRETKGAPSSFQAYVISKCGVLIMSLFVFFTTTMSVSFTLRETQSRMLKFTVQLQYHARHRLPTFRLIFVHVIESLVFVPIMIGILFFLFEFYEDQLLAFMVLTLVWLCELFTLISVRTSVSMQYFPRFFFLYFMVFHIYFFSFEYGFSYLAFSTTAAFMQHLILYFWNHFEVPALESFILARMLFQQPGVQITSSAVITSTLHVSQLAPAGIQQTTVADLGGPVQNGLEENARNLSFLQHLRRSPVGEASQLWTDNAVDRLWLEHWNGRNNRVPDITRSTGNGHEESNSANENPSENLTGTRDTNAGQQNLHASAGMTIPQANGLNPFVSILLWILGGPSVHLSSYPPAVRDGDHSTSNESNVSHGSLQREGGFQRLRRRIRNMLENDR